MKQHFTNFLFSSTHKYPLWEDDSSFRGEGRRHRVVTERQLRARTVRHYEWPLTPGLRPQSRGSRRLLTHGKQEPARQVWTRLVECVLPFVPAASAFVWLLFPILLSASALRQTGSRLRHRVHFYHCTPLFIIPLKLPFPVKNTTFTEVLHS